MGGRQNRPRYFVDWKLFLPLLEVDGSSVVQPPVSSLIITSNTLSRLALSLENQNLNLNLCSFCSSEVTLSALSNILKEYSIILLTVKLNLSQQLLLRINLLFW